VKPIIPMVVCSVCDLKVSRIKQDKRFVDDKGNPWKGDECPECVALLDALEPPRTTKRKCRECGDNLPLSRYFKCTTCQPVMSDIDDDLVYEVQGKVYNTDEEVDSEDDYYGFAHFHDGEDYVPLKEEGSDGTDQDQEASS
jgi:hypothetical protein